jgi:hypothetical protein
MVIRQRTASLLWFLLLLISGASSQPDAECHLEVNDYKYDLSALKGDKSISRTRSLPPTTMTDTLRFNICNELSSIEGVGSADQVSVRDTLQSLFRLNSCSVPAGRGPVLARRTSSKGSRIESLRSFLLRTSQSCRRNTPCCHVRSSTPFFWSSINWPLHVSPTRCQNVAAWSPIPFIHHIRACTTGIRHQLVMCDGNVRARVQVV